MLWALQDACGFGLDWSQRVRRLHDELDRAFDTTAFGGGNGSLPVTVTYTPHEVRVLCTAGGVSKENMLVSVEGQTLRLRMKRRAIPEKIAGRIIHRERLDGDMYRDIELPFPVKADEVQATLQDGLLSLSLPRREEDKPRRIEIKTNN